MDDALLPELCDVIERQSYKMICINDSQNIHDFEKCRDGVISSFQKILSNKSHFEI